MYLSINSSQKLSDMRDSGESRDLAHFRKCNQNKLEDLEGFKTHFSSISKSEIFFNIKNRDSV